MLERSSLCWSKATAMLCSYNGILLLWRINFDSDISYCGQGMKIINCACTGTVRKANTLESDAVEMDQVKPAPRPDPDNCMCRVLPPMQPRQRKVCFLHCYKHPAKCLRTYQIKQLLTYLLESEASCQLTASISEERPTNWQKAWSGAVRKYVNWDPLGIRSAADTEDGISGERSRAAASSLSAPCIAWKF